MTADTAFVFALIVVAAAMMASNRVRFDIVALLVVLALMLSGVLSVGEALSGFGNPVVILVAALLVVGEMLDRTGVVDWIGDLILRKGGAQRNAIVDCPDVRGGDLGSFHEFHSGRRDFHSGRFARCRGNQNWSLTPVASNVLCGLDQRHAHFDRYHAKPGSK